MQKLVAGALGGALAGAPMAVAMKAMQQSAPSARRRALPPKEITLALARRIGLAHQLDHRGRNATTAAAHIGYGSAAGALYPYVSRVLPGPTLLKGALFGAGLWAGSYLGWLPATGILRSATREPAGRNAMMIGAHLVWGVATAVTAERLLARGRRRTNGDARGDEIEEEEREGARATKAKRRRGSAA
jgi:uncharacterized membrane protein YagU involved in acid resistance